MIEQGAADGGFVRDFSVARIGFLRADQVISLGREIFFLNCYPRPHRYHIFRHRTLFHDDRIAQGEFEFLDAAFEKALILFGFVVIGVLGEIAHLDGGAQAFG